MTNERRRRSAPQNGVEPASPHQLSTEPLAFEEALGRLDQTVTALEGGQLPLEEAIRLYEEGVHLAQRCQHILDHAELQVRRLQIATNNHDTRDVGDIRATDEAFALDDFESSDAE